VEPTFALGGPLDFSVAHMFQSPGFPESLYEQRVTEDASSSFSGGRSGVDLVYVLSNLRITGTTAGSTPSHHFATVATVERLFVTSIELMRLRKVSELLRKQLLFQYSTFWTDSPWYHEKNLHYTNQLKLWEEVHSVSVGVQRCLSPSLTARLRSQQVEQSIWRIACW